MVRKRSLLRKALWGLLAFAVLAACTEAALRWGLGLGNPILIAPDPACSYVTRPNQNVYRFFVHTYINRYGMRSAEVSPERPPGVVRVLFVGDSVTYGTTHVDQKNLFSQIVGRGLPSIVHEKVEVLNASVNGWAPDNEWEWVRTRGIFQSNYVLLVLNDGDLTQPLAKIDQVGDSLPQTRPLTAINELFTRFIKPRILHIQPHQDPGDVAVPDAATERANLQDLDHFDDSVRNQQGQMAIVFLPFRADLPHPADKALGVLQTWTATHHVPLIDLSTAIAAHSVPEICIYDHLHFNTAGNAVIAQAILNQWPNALRP
ncbi:MAG TPA: SGNH/GDSL hydrolase family protein [Acidobacteriaceae bacterium]|nr:SGNH/GDSL hydrolase family protein [Acidobacteriaceae bacterium]